MRKCFQMPIHEQGGLAGLLKENYRKPKIQLEPHIERVRTLFEKQPPHTVNHAIDMIFEETEVRLKHSACQTCCFSGQFRFHPKQTIQQI